jgi:hypothetical protein
LRALELDTVGRIYERSVASYRAGLIATLIIPAVAPWHLILNCVSTCLSARETVKESLDAASRRDGIEAFMLKLSVSAAFADAQLRKAKDNIAITFFIVSFFLA